jgi:uncharacterized protein (TIGR02246 family)
VPQRFLIRVASSLLLLCAPLAAAEPADELRAAEIAFAATVAEHDAERFASFIDEDAVFLGATALRGRAAIVQAWSVFFAEDGPKLSWQPDVVEVRPDGLGLSRGPYTLTTMTESGVETTSSGQFQSIWRRGSDGSWKVLFDSGCPADSDSGEGD